MKLALSNSEAKAFRSGASVSNKRLAFADGLRGLAACWVVLFHMSEGKHIEALHASLPSFVYRVFFSMGDLGVPVFFVLSGYVMALTTTNLNFNASVGLRFIARRLIRLMPAYYAAIALVLAFSAVKYKVLGQGLIDFNFQILTAHAFLAQGFFNIKNIDPVFWTLCIEIQFYIFFAFLMWANNKLSGSSEGSNRGYYFILISSVAALLWPLGLAAGSVWPGGFLPYWYCFMAGVWASLSRGGAPTIQVGAICYALVLMGSGLLLYSGVAMTAAITSLFLMLAAYQRKEGVWLSYRWIQFLGMISYSLYLLHNPLTGATFNIFKRVFPSNAVSEFVGIVMVAVVCVGVSFIAYCLIERPSISLSRCVRLVAAPARPASRSR